MLRTIIVSAASLVALVAAQPAFAADLPEYQPAPAYAAPAASNWTGGYVGVQGGYSSAHANNKNGAANTKPKGGVVGAYAGYDYQFDGSPVVVGVDTDINYNTNDDKRGGVRNELNWSGATRAKLGYGMDRVMIYGAGGVAYGGEKVRAGGAGTDKTALGWTAGGGIEGKISENVTARAEYRYTDYGTSKFGTGAGTVKSDLTENRVTAGVAYKFSAW